MRKKLFIIKLMSFGSAMEPAGKLSIQAEILAIKAEIKRYTFKQMQDMGGKFAVVLTARPAAKNCGSRLTRNTLLKGVPLIGGAFGATFNYEFINKIANVTNKIIISNSLQVYVHTEVNFRRRTNIY
ncbi:EcsC family protein [Terrisporobacter sp. DSM 29186]|uniref:EcsC family protein n=1 Tax=Terrisporobacter muris TaxID=2963284 RepID=A0A9X2MCJ6_9FIRM|nr:EcsC family protein [Terrisporobacter muris]